MKQATQTNTPQPKPQQPKSRLKNLQTEIQHSKTKNNQQNTAVSDGLRGEAGLAWRGTARRRGAVWHNEARGWSLAVWSVVERERERGRANVGCGAKEITEQNKKALCTK